MRELTSERPFFWSSASISLTNFSSAGSWHRALGTGNAQPLKQFIAVKLFACAVLLDDHWRSENWPLIGAEALMARQTLPAPADATMASLLVSITFESGFWQNGQITLNS